MEYFQEGLRIIDCPETQDGCDKVITSHLLMYVLYDNTAD